MNAFSNVRTSVVTGLVVVGLLSLVGCGAGDDLGTRYPVSGTVKYKGEPLAKGSITFMGEKGQRGASGEIKNGQYTLTAVNEGDGAFPGNYSVTIESLDLDLGKVEAQAKAFAAKNNMQYNESMIDQQTLAKARASAKSSIPKKYGQATTSGLKAEVKAQSNTLNYDLTD
jgi:hypothetical protein